MSRREAGGFASRKPLEFPRRSCRERQAVYMSLDENFLLSAAANTSLFRSLVNEANASRSQVNGSFYIEPTHLAGYSTRSKDRYVLKSVEIEDSSLPINANSDDDEDAENNASRHSNRQNRKNKAEVLNNDDARDSESPEGLCEIDETEGSPGKIAPEQDEVLESICEGIKRQRRPAADAARANWLSASNRSLRTSKCHMMGGQGKTLEGSDIRKGAAREGEEPEEYEGEQKGYSLRRHRPPVVRLCLGEQQSRRCLLSHSGRKSQVRRARRGYSDSPNSEFSFSEEDEFDMSPKSESRQAFRPLNYTNASGDTAEADFHEIIRKTGFNVDSERIAVDAGVNFSHVGGLDSHLQSLKEIVLFPMLYPQLFSQFGVTPPKGVLFYGPPGTGKTLVARALANVCSVGDRKVTFFMRKGGDCLTKWFGESEKHLRLLFEKAYEARPSIIFFDEIDGLAPARSSDRDMAHCTVVSTLLSLMDGLSNRGEVIVIGATNRLDSLDPALRRPGRFDRELRFGLPDANARRAIIKINTSAWKSCQLSDEVLDYLAGETAGYCGADLKFLCTEAVMIAVRSQLPQIYSTEARLEVDATSVQVSVKHFQLAMQRLLPAGRRDLSVPSARMCERVSRLLKGTVDFILSDSDRIPLGYRSPPSDHNLNGLERTLKFLEPSPVVPAARLLLYGNSAHMGQTSYVLPALISRLDHLPVFSLSIANLYSSGAPERNFAEAMRAAMQVAYRGSPCIILIPSIDIWQLTVPQPLWYQLVTTLSSLTGFTSILFLASAERLYDALSDEIKSLFHPQHAFEVGAPSDELRRSFFSHVIVESALEEPKVFDPAMYPELPLAASPTVLRPYTAGELEALKRMYDADHVQITIHYQESLMRLMRDKRFHHFDHPVDPNEVPDYPSVIKKPMDLWTMYEKTERYECPNEFLDDFDLIYKNAIEYNSTSTSEGRNICNAAKLLRNFGRRAYHDLDYAFVMKHLSMRRVLIENGVSVGFEDTVARSAVSAGEVKPAEADVVATENAHDAHILSTFATKKKNKIRFAKKRRSFRTEQRSGGVKIRRVSSQSDVLGEHRESSKALDVDAGDSSKPGGACAVQSKEPESAERMETVEMEESREESEESLDDGKDNSLVAVLHQDLIYSESSNDKLPSPSPPVPPSLKISEKELGDAVELAVSKTSGWPIVQLENLAAGLLQKVALFRDTWDRSKLPKVLTEVIDGWNLDYSLNH